MAVDGSSQAHNTQQLIQCTDYWVGLSPSPAFEGPDSDPVDKLPPASFAPDVWGLGGTLYNTDVWPRGCRSGPPLPGEAVDVKKSFQPCQGKKPPHSGHFRSYFPLFTSPLPPHFSHLHGNTLYVAAHTSGAGLRVHYTVETQTLHQR